MTKKTRRTAAEKPQANKFVNVRLNQAHTHAGMDYKPGNTITVSEADARWLIEHSIGVAAAPTTAREE